MSAGDYPPQVGETISLISDFNINIPAVPAGILETNVLQDSTGAVEYLTVPPGSWILSGYVLVNTDNANDTDILTLQPQIFNFTNNAGAGGLVIGFGQCLYNTTIPANTATQVLQVSVAVSCPVSSFYSLFLTVRNTDQIINVPLGQASLYAQYLGPTKTNNVRT